MPLIDQPLHETTLLIGRAPPGLGGSSAAILAGLLGLSMIRMALAVSEGKEDPAPGLGQALQRVDAIRDNLSAAADKDRAAFRAYLDRIKEPQEPAEGREPEEERHEAGLETVSHLLEGAGLIVDGLECATSLAGDVARTVESDLFGGAALLDAAFLGVSLAIQINLRAERLQPERTAIENQARALSARRAEAFSAITRGASGSGFAL